MAGKEISSVYPARTEKLQEVLDQLHKLLEGWPPKTLWQLDLAAEEIFVNICSYAYPDGPGEVRIELCLEGDTVRLTFADTGLPFDPLAVPDPDLARPVEQRDPGGLGILLVKKLMDRVEYTYADRENRLTLYRSIRAADRAEED